MEYQQIYAEVLVFWCGGVVAGSVLGLLVEYAVSFGEWLERFDGLGGSGGYKTHCWVLR